jgi:hypothetical protein
MASSLPNHWWDQALDGRLYYIDLRDTTFTNMPAFRAACYREAEKRRVAVTTTKAGINLALIQAYGTPDMLPEQPNLPHAAKRVGIRLRELDANPISRDCSCGKGPITHSRECGIWGSPQPLLPDPVVRVTDPPSLAQIQYEAAILADGNEEFTKKVLGDILDSCDCGQDPFCLPECARNGGPATEEELARFQVHRPDVID